MASATIPAVYLKSCRRRNEYPCKLVDRSRYGVPLLKQCRERFQKRQTELRLFAPIHEFFVPYWEISRDGRVEQRNLLSEDELASWLGDEFQQDSQTPGQVLGVKPDPPCRFM
jgi:hypothetical protein